MRERVRRFWQAPARDERGSAGLEVAIGAMVVGAIAAVAFDVYAAARVDTAGARMAVTMADYVARDSTPNGNDMSALGQYMHQHVLPAPAHLVFVVSAAHQPTGGNPPALLWDDDTLRYGDPQETTNLAQECRKRGDSGWRQTLLGDASNPPMVKLPDDTVVIVVEVCAALTLQGSLTGHFVSGNTYRIHAAPVRGKGQQHPASPAYSSLDERLLGGPATRMASGPAAPAVTVGSA